MKKPDLMNVHRLVVGAGISSAAVMLLTAFHHIYGAVIYQTPWRHHVALVSLATTLFIGLTLYVFYKKQTAAVGHLALWLAVAAIALIPVGMIGLFEGVYNHLLKNMLFFAGASVPSLHQLFPPPAYEMPNDVTFEVTGVLQAFFAFVAACYGYWLLANGMKRISVPERAILE